MSLQTGYDLEAEKDRAGSPPEHAVESLQEAG
jgi:hypothetical protein